MAIPEKGNNWFTKSLRPCWYDYKDLNYVNEPFNDDATVQQWRKLGFDQQKFTGDMYDMRYAEPNWMPQIRKNFDWEYFSWSIYRMSPGCVLPQHRDTYARFARVYEIENIDLIWRAVIFLENWQSGHYLEVDGNPIVNWAAGDCVVWRSTTPHVAANIGETDRYTLQVTGVIYENSFV